MQHGSSVLLTCRRMLVEDGFAQDVIDPMLAALRAAHEKNSPAQFFYEAAHETGLTETLIQDRAAPCFMMFAAINLMDDIQDGDCDYLPANIAPAVQMTLALKAVQPFSTHVLPLKRLIQLASGQVLQEAKKPYIVVADQIASAQYEAYMTVLWDDTQFEDVAPAVGRALGYVGHVEADLATKDPRLVGLSPEDQKPVLDKARFYVKMLQSYGINCVNRFLASIKNLPEA